MYVQESIRGLKSFCLFKCCLYFTLLIPPNWSNQDQWRSWFFYDTSDSPARRKFTGIQYLWNTVRGLTGTPPTPLNVAVLCHLTVVLIFLPYPDREARWKQKERQEEFNIALRSHIICPFHEHADWRSGNMSPHYKQAQPILRSLVRLGYQPVR